MADDQADDPLSWGHYQIVNGRRRSADLFLATLSQLCASEGSNFVAPFLDTTFLAALGAWGGPLGKGDGCASRADPVPDQQGNVRGGVLGSGQQGVCRGLGRYRPRF